MCDGLYDCHDMSDEDCGELKVLPLIRGFHVKCFRIFVVIFEYVFAFCFFVVYFLSFIGFVSSIFFMYEKLELVGIRIGINT